MIAYKPSHVFRQLPGVVRIEDKSVLAMCDHLPASRKFGTQHWLSECHTLEHGNSPGILPGRRNKDIGVSVIGAQIVICHRANRMNDATKAAIPDGSAHFYFLLTRADQH